MLKTCRIIQQTQILSQGKSPKSSGWFFYFLTVLNICNFVILRGSNEIASLTGLSVVFASKTEPLNYHSAAFVQAILPLLHPPAPPSPCAYLQ